MFRTLEENRRVRNATRIQDASRSRTKHHEVISAGPADANMRPVADLIQSASARTISSMDISLGDLGLILGALGVIGVLVWETFGVRSDAKDKTNSKKATKK